ncbi:phosphoribosyltransferase [Azomonas macrocytogenes]|uniref:Putative phosphoribosyltransferase n=1 Tax=Azomonas macrocytogenes TaxID=69962 RepID=A0A839SX80_AZOMA|nr:phosphoribosyltransferase [Azomonas macrocytogenes]MBB3101722.1 putative phosphoribosyltransferase [Azomonas macrocytogenes]
MNPYLPSTPAFKDRREAGRALAKVLRPLLHDRPVILALPRGGVPVAYEIALAFQAPLDVILVRKIGMPGREEFGIGAVVDGADPRWVVDEALLKYFHLSTDWFEAEKARQLQEIKRRRAVYCGERAPIPVAGREVIVVDDGVATGNTAKVALMALADSQPSRLIFAIPVGAEDSLIALRPLVDELVCLVTPEPFRAVGLHYEHFDQTTDQEVIDLLAKARETNQ